MSERPDDTPGSQPLDERKEQILRQIVENYVRSGEPVGSKTVADDPDLGVSSATVRNEMGILEREGYIRHPHTSAGRIPTDKGYRYYVDSLAPHKVVPVELRGEVEQLLVGTMSALDDLLKQASGLLAELTNYASLAATPPAAEANLRHIQLVPLGGSRVFLIAVGEGAWHEERVLELSVEPDEEDVRRAGEVLTRLCAGRTLAEGARSLADASADPELGPILDAAAEGMRYLALRAGRVFTGGASRVVLWEPGPEARRVLEVLESHEVEPLLQEPDPEEVAIRIGKELGLEDLEDLSLIASGYRFGRRVGALGVLGPTRMDYPTVVATVAEVASTLSEALRRISTS